jgi:hypothetical protein
VRRTLILTVIVLAVTVIGPVMPTAAEDVVDVRYAEIDVAPADTPTGFADTRPWTWTTSRTMETTPFALLALELPGEVEVQVRTARGDGPFSGWTTVPHQHDEAPDPSTSEAQTSRVGHRTHPIWTGIADRLEVRTTGDPAELRAHLIDPFGLDRSAAQTIRDRMRTAWHDRGMDVAHALADQPPIVSRAQWGADEGMVEHGPSYARSVDRAFVHHTVGSNGYTQAQAAAVVRAVMAFHINGNGWNDIGYNFLIDRFGTIYEGRAGGIDRAVIGAQAGGFNTSSTGVAMMGTFTSGAPPAAAMQSLDRLLAWIADVHHFHPLRASQATSLGSTRFPAGTEVSLSTISGHRDVSSTACPGDAVYPLLPQIRDRARSLAGDLIVDHRSDIEATRVIRGTPDADSITFSAELDPPGDWQVEVVAPDGTQVHRDSGSGAVVTSTMPLTGSDWQLGEYRWSVRAPGRRTATEVVAFEPPRILGLRTSTELATADADGSLVDPVAIAADLWDSASWQVAVTDAAGAVVYEEAGQGEVMAATWTGRVGAPGTYRITVTAEDALPASLPVEVRYDLLDRVADVDDAVSASVMLSQTTFDSRSAERAVIARSDVFADALAGGPLAGPDGPVLLTTPDVLDGRVADELARVLATDATIYVLGGDAAISDDVVRDLISRHGDVVRLSGPTRFATAAAIAGVVVERSGTDRALVARAGPDDAQPWADALAGGAWGAREGVPVLLTDTDRLDPATSDDLDDLGIDRTIVLGGEAAVSRQVAQQLPRPVRLAGDDRTATAVAVAEQLWGPDVDQIVLATAHQPDAWAWALAAAPLSARMGAPLLTTPSDALVVTTAGYLQRNGQITGGVVVGSSRLVSPAASFEASALIRP